MLPTAGLNSSLRSSPTPTSVKNKASRDPGAAWPAVAQSGLTQRSPHISRAPGQYVQRQAEYDAMDEYVEDFTNFQLQTGGGFRGCEDEEQRDNLKADISGSTPPAAKRPAAMAPGYSSGIHIPAMCRLLMKGGSPVRSTNGPSQTGVVGPSTKTIPVYWL